MSETSANNKRIAKNTILLYMRMLLIMAVTLYTSRVVLNTLGIEDYGIYNVVGGIVTMFAFLNGAMITSTQRYLTFELGRGDLMKLKQVFATSIHIHLMISIITIFFTETIGLWFFYNKMVIPESRIEAAMWVLQLSVITMVVQIMSVPYNSTIVAHEDMGVFAIISIIETVLKLTIVFLLTIGHADRLVLYAVLIAIVQLLVFLLYSIYCYKSYKESHSIRLKEKSLFFEMAKFAGWNVWGNLAAMLMGTGLNILLNIFFGPIVNAARAIAVQVEGALNQFSTSFLMAVNPQITKLYAQHNINEMHQLLFRASKFTFFLLLTLSMPVLVETEMILTLWLKVVPDYTITFLRLLLLIMLVDGVSKPLMTAAAATGNVKIYQSVIGGILLCVVPISYVALRYGGRAEFVYVIYLIILIIAFIARLIIVRSLINLSLRQYLYFVLLRCGFIFILAILLSLLIKNMMPYGMLFSITTCFLCMVIVVLSSYCIGLTSEEQNFVQTKLVWYLKKITNKYDLY